MKQIWSIEGNYWHSVKSAIVTLDKTLAITVQIFNASATKIINYEHSRSCFPTLVDEFDNKYKIKRINDVSLTIYPEQTITDCYFFEQPVSKATCLRLTIPGHRSGLGWRTNLRSIKSVQGITGEKVGAFIAENEYKYDIDFQIPAGIIEYEVDV